MGRGDRRYRRSHLPVESCHGLTAWNYFQAAQMGEDDDKFGIWWRFDDETCKITIRLEGVKWKQSVDLTWQPCGLGGRRRWFRCPRCRRRVGKLYLPTTMYSGGERVHEFRCRECYDLTYLQHQRHDQYFHLLYRADRIADRWLGKFYKSRIAKRKGQHWKTFEKRLAQYNSLIARSNAIAYAGLAAAFRRSR